MTEIYTGQEHSLRQARIKFYFEKQFALHNKTKLNSLA
jgi:hypothetical protein